MKHLEPRVKHLQMQAEGRLHLVPGLHAIQVRIRTLVMYTRVYGKNGAKLYVT